MKLYRAWVSRDEDGKLKLWVPSQIMLLRAKDEGINTLDEYLNKYDSSRKMTVDNMFRRDHKWIDEDLIGFHEVGCWICSGPLEYHDEIFESELPRMINPKWEDDYPIEVEVSLRAIIK